MNIKSLIIIIGFVVMGITAFSQIRVEFSYDNSGNRFERKVIDLNKSAIIGQSSNKNWNEAVIDQLSNYEIKIYPNPTKGRIKIEIPEINKILAGSMKVFDNNGRTVYQQKNIKPSNLVDISHVKNGFYFLKLRYQHETLEWKIIKK